VLGEISREGKQHDGVALNLHQQLVARLKLQVAPDISRDHDLVLCAELGCSLNPHIPLPFFRSPYIIQIVSQLSRKFWPRGVRPRGGAHHRVPVRGGGRDDAGDGRVPIGPPAEGGELPVASGGGGGSVAARGGGGLPGGPLRAQRRGRSRVADTVGAAAAGPPPLKERKKGLRRAAVTPSRAWWSKGHSVKNRLAPFALFSSSYHHRFGL